MVVALVALAIGAAAVAPFFFTHSADIEGRKHFRLITTHDIKNHYLYMENFAASVRQGVLYPQWFGEANNGYGIAVINYYPPGFYYLTTAVNSIFNDWHSTLFSVMTLALGAS